MQVKSMKVRSQLYVFLNFYFQIHRFYTYLGNENWNWIGTESDSCDEDGCLDCRRLVFCSAANRHSRMSFFASARTIAGNRRSVTATRRPKIQIDVNKIDENLGEMNNWILSFTSEFSLHAFEMRSLNILFLNVLKCARALLTKKNFLIIFLLGCLSPTF